MGITVQALSFWGNPILSGGYTISRDNDDDDDDNVIFKKRLYVIFQPEMPLSKLRSTIVLFTTHTGRD